MICERLFDLANCSTNEVKYSKAQGSFKIEKGSEGEGRVEGGKWK